MLCQTLYLVDATLEEQAQRKQSSISIQKTSYPNLTSRRKAAEARVANLIQTLDAAGTPPETLTMADSSQNRPLRPLLRFSRRHALST